MSVGDEQARSMEQTNDVLSYHAKAQAKHRRGMKTDLRAILAALPKIQAELREQRRLLEYLTAVQSQNGRDRNA